MKVETEDEEILWENQEVVDNIVKEEYSIEENHETVNSSNQFVEAYPEDESSEDEILTAVRAAVLKQQAAGKRKVAIKCHICGEKFYGASTLRAHLFKHKTTQIDNSRRKKKPNKVSCKFCPGTLFNSGELNMHMQINHQCLLCGQEVLNEQMREAHLREFHAEHDPHFTKEEEEKFNCSSCNESFSQQHDLDAHTEEQHDATSFFCLLCNEKFQTKAILLNHMKSHQSPKANKMTKGVKEETPKEFPCDECNEVFHSIEDYVNHKRIHVRNRLPGILQRIQCDFCSETFADTTEFNKHLHMHVSSKNRASFVCDYCNADFFTEKAYISHIRDHKTSLECPYCLKSFEQRLDKEFHMRWNHPGLPMNSPVLPTRCSICKLILSTSDDVKNHSTQHVMNSMEPLPEPKLSVQNIKPKLVPKANKTKGVRGKYKKRRSQSEIQHEKEMKQQKMEEKQQKVLTVEKPAQPASVEPPALKPTEQISAVQKGNFGNTFKISTIDSFVGSFESFVNNYGSELDIPKKPPKFQKKR
uniref:C2H2-type domain-containing protein n=2 Tax=Lutzomyia longipalpis TaxID=7200 RepID=A0A1B0CKX7_LUTLO